MSQCLGVTKKGRLCHAGAPQGTNYCPYHDPDGEYARKFPKVRDRLRRQRAAGDTRTLLDILQGES